MNPFGEQPTIRSPLGATFALKESKGDTAGSSPDMTTDF
jgi:hypothetical protein